jgi:TnpA family transposase
MRYDNLRYSHTKITVFYIKYGGPLSNNQQQQTISKGQYALKKVSLFFYAVPMIPFC